MVREVWEAQRLPCLSILMVRVPPVRLAGLLVRVYPALQNAQSHQIVPVARPLQNVPVIPVLLRFLRVAHLNGLLRVVILLSPRELSHQAKLLPCPRWVVALGMRQVVRQNGPRRLMDLKSRVAFPVLRRLQHHVRLL